MSELVQYAIESVYIRSLARRTGNPGRKNFLGKSAAISWIFFCATNVHSNAASAVATATNPKTGGLAYSYAQGGLFTEAQQKSRVTQDCLSQGYTNPKVIASTTKGGYGAIVAFETANQPTKYAVSLAAVTQKEATRDALEKAKTAGARTTDIVATWHDVSSPPPRPGRRSPTSVAIDAKGVAYVGSQYPGRPPWMDDVVHSVIPDYPYYA